MNQEIPESTKRAVIAELMSKLSKRRKPEQCKGGRPRSKRRCPCGLMTVRMATLRCHHCE